MTQEQISLLASLADNPAFNVLLEVLENHKQATLRAIEQETDTPRLLFYTRHYQSFSTFLGLLKTNVADAEDSLKDMLSDPVSDPYRDPLFR